MPATIKKNSKEGLIDELALLSDEVARRKFIARHKALVRKEFVEQLAQLVVQRVRVSTQEALHLAEAAVLIAKRLRGDFLPFHAGAATRQGREPEDHCYYG